MRRDHRGEAPGRYTKPAKTQGRIWGALGHFPGLEEPSRCFQGAQNTIKATVSRNTCTRIYDSYVQPWSESCSNCDLLDHGSDSLNHLNSSTWSAPSRWNCWGSKLQSQNDPRGLKREVVIALYGFQPGMSHMAYGRC